jgi:hypothetical protein
MNYITPFAPLAYLWALWVLYVFTMGIYRARLAGRLSPSAKVLGMPFVLLAVLMDALCNLTLAALVFAERPREWLVTQRLKRYLSGADGWRKTLAVWLCTNLLDAFDGDGHHC